MAHTKAKGSARINKDSISKRLGVKKFGGEAVDIGMIIVRQRGSKFKPGNGVQMGKDHTLFSVKQGKVEFYTKFGKPYIRVV
jgi:large subunit ribosomal protein L27